MKCFKKLMLRKVCLVFTLFILINIGKCFSQSTVMEITWTDVEYVNYKGLLVLYPNNNGFIKIKYYLTGVGDVWVYQDAIFSYQSDYFGNITSYINCFNPNTQPYTPYSADNFVIFPNGRMYTQDYSGKWSTLVSAVNISYAYWSMKFKEYNINL